MSTCCCSCWTSPSRDTKRTAPPTGSLCTAGPPQTTHNMVKYPHKVLPLKNCTLSSHAMYDVLMFLIVAHISGKIWIFSPHLFGDMSEVECPDLSTDFEQVLSLCKELDISKSSDRHHIASNIFKCEVLVEN